MKKMVSFFAALTIAVPTAVVPVLAEPGDGIVLGNTTISPFAELVGRYDSNVFQTKDNTEDDVYGDAAIGVALKNKTEVMDLSGRVWGQLRRYADRTEKDADDWGESLGLTVGQREQVAMAIYQRYAQLEDYDRTPGSVDRMNLKEVALDLSGDRSERAKRDIFDATIGLGKAFTDKIESDASYAYYDVNYKDDGYNDWKEHRGELSGRYNVTDKTAALLVGEVGLQDSKGLEDNSELGILRLGVDHKLTSKTKVRAEGGFEHYKNGAANSDDINIFNYRINGSWAATERLTIKVIGRNGIYPASVYAENVKDVTALSLGGYLSVNEAIQVSLVGSFSEDKYEENVDKNGESVEDKAKHYGAQARVDYQPPVKFFNVYASVSFMDTDSTIEDYEQWKAALGLQVRY